jgi:adenylate kinase
LQLSDHFEAKVVSVGDLLKKEVSKKTDIGQTIDEYMKNMLYTPDDQVVKILVSHLSTLDKTQNVIIEGFPKTLYQSMAIVKAKVIPDLLVVVNYPESDCQTFLKRKFTEHDSEQWAELSESERKSRGKEYLVQYNL